MALWRRAPWCARGTPGSAVPRARTRARPRTHRYTTEGLLVALRDLLGGGRKRFTRCAHGNTLAALRRTTKGKGQVTGSSRSGPQATKGGQVTWSSRSGPQERDEPVGEQQESDLMPESHAGVRWGRCWGEYFGAMAGAGHVKEMGKNGAWRYRGSGAATVEGEYTGRGEGRTLPLQ